MNLFMKKFIIVIVLLVSLTSCFDRIKVDRHKITLDGNEQEVVITANTSISSMEIECGERTSYQEIENAMITTGSWFEVIVKADSVRKAKVVVSKNESGVKRKLKVILNNYKYEDACTITQNPL